MIFVRKDLYDKFPTEPQLDFYIFNQVKKLVTV